MCITPIQMTLNDFYIDRVIVSKIKSNERYNRSLLLNDMIQNNSELRFTVH